MIPQELFCSSFIKASLAAQRVKRLPTMQETWVQSLDLEDPLEKGMATHSSTLAWKIPWTGKPGRQQSMRSKELDMTEQLHFTKERKETEKASDIDIRRGMDSAPLVALARELYTF